MAEKIVAPKVEQTAPEAEAISLIDDYGCIIKPIVDIITTKQPEAETAEETED